MRKIVISLVVIVLVAMVGFSTVSCTRIDAGHVGIKVNLYGTDKGVQDIVEVSGMVWYNPVTTQIYEFPTYVQHKVWTLDTNEDSPTNEEFTVTTRDGLSLSFDVGLDYTVIPSKVADIFRTYRKDLKQITSEFIRTLVRNAYNNTASKYTAEDMVSKRSEYETQVKEMLSKDMDKGGFIVTQVAILGKIRMPQTLEDAVNSKIKAVQDAIRAENEKQRTIAEAQKEIEQAKGKAEAMRINSEAEANANRALTTTMSPLLIQKMMIEKWDGKLPVYGEVPKMFRNVADQK
jgi:regulator of protease activity HflC (stomatin/prohibitin superfamily)